MTGISRGTPQSVSRPSMTFHIGPGLAITDCAGGRLRDAYLLRPPGAGVAHAILIQAPGQQPAQRIQGKVPQDAPHPGHKHVVPAHQSAVSASCCRECVAPH